MKINGKLIKGTKIVKDASAEIIDGELSYRELLEKCLIQVCRQLDIPVPLWLKKNTTEFARYKRTFFSSEQFVEKVTFDRFEIRVED